jgi:hypothetical protein
MSAEVARTQHGGTNVSQVETRGESLSTWLLNDEHFQFEPDS